MVANFPKKATTSALVEKLKFRSMLLLGFGKKLF